MFELRFHIWFFSGNCRIRRTKFHVMIQRGLKVLMRIIQSFLILEVTNPTKVLVMNHQPLVWNYRSLFKKVMQKVPRKSKVVSLTIKKLFNYSKILFVEMLIYHKMWIELNIMPFFGSNSMNIHMYSTNSRLTPRFQHYNCIFVSQKHPGSTWNF